MNNVNDSFTQTTGSTGGGYAYDVGAVPEERVPILSRSCLCGDGTGGMSITTKSFCHRAYVRTTLVLIRCHGRGGHGYGNGKGPGLVVSANTSGFQSLGGELFILIGDEMGVEKEVVNVGTLASETEHTSLERPLKPIPKVSVTSGLGSCGFCPRTWAPPLGRLTLPIPPIGRFDMSRDPSLLR